MKGSELAYTVATGKSVEEAVAAVETATERNGFRVLATHDVGRILAEKGFERDPIVIVEVCNAKYASAVLAEDVAIGTLLPCKVNVYRDGGQTYLSALRPAVLSEFFPSPVVAQAAQEVENRIRAIVDEAR